MARPTPITILGAFQVVGGACTLFLGIGVLRNPGAATTWGLPPMFSALGTAAGALLIASGILNLAVGWGLLKLLNWARIVMLAITGLSLVGSAMGILLGGVMQEAVAMDVLRLGVFALDALIIWYLLRPESKQAFTPRAPSGQPGVPPAEPPTAL
jgi:hypothetical protein